MVFVEGCPRKAPLLCPEVDAAWWASPDSRSHGVPSWGRHLWVFEVQTSYPPSSITGIDRDQSTLPRSNSHHEWRLSRSQLEGLFDCNDEELEEYLDREEYEATRD